MATDESKGGKIKRIYRTQGIGTIRPDSGGGDVIFTDGAVRGGRRGFKNLREGDLVRYRTYPDEIAGKEFAEDIYCEDEEPPRGSR